MFLIFSELKHDKNKKSSTAKTLLFKHTTDDGDHNYATPMEIASLNKLYRSNATPTNTPEKAHMEKKPKGTSSGEPTNMSMETILYAIDSL